MRLWRVVAWDPSAATGSRGHPLHVPRSIQGAGRHDNPGLYGALYLSERPVAAVAEMIAHLRGDELDDADLERNGLRLALVAFEATVDGTLWDLDDPTVLVDRALRPSLVATGVRRDTQRMAAALHRARPRRLGIRWWSTLEASWIHVTLFERALAHTSIAEAPEPLRVDHATVREAAEVLGVRLV